MIKVFGPSPLREEIKIDWMNFSAGESFFKMNNSEERFYKIVWNYQNDSEFFQLRQLVDFIREKNSMSYIDLFVPYMPHSRQDRYSGVGQPYSLKICMEMLSLIFKPEERKNMVYNELINFKISTLDLHSDVALKQFPKLNILNIDSSIFAEEKVIAEGNYDYVVSPDKGAKQRALNWACKLDLPMLVCDKVRDPNTGKLSNPRVPKADLEGKKVLIVDDICDGGYTFIQLAEQLKARGATSDLFVSHGIFSKGLDELFKNVARIYTTDSLFHNFSKYKSWINTPKLTVFNCKERVKF